MGSRALGGNCQTLGPVGSRLSGIKGTAKPKGHLIWVHHPCLPELWELGALLGACTQVESRAQQVYKTHGSPDTLGILSPNVCGQLGPQYTG